MAGKKDFKNSNPTLKDPVPDKHYNEATLSFKIALFSPKTNLAHSVNMTESPSIGLYSLFNFPYKVNSAISFSTFLTI